MDGGVLQRAGRVAAGPRPTRLRPLVAAIVAGGLLGVPSPAGAQLDFAGAAAVKIRTYPLKRVDGRLVAGGDGMPEPAEVRDGRPGGIAELPAFPVDENQPGGTILQALVHHHRRDPVGALRPVLAVLDNGYLELDIEKACQIDAVRIRYEHQPTPEVPSFREHGLAALMHVVTDAVAAADLHRAHGRLRDRYNRGLSTDPGGDQDAMALFQGLRLAIASRYVPAVTAPGLAGLPPGEARQRFKAALGQGAPLEAELEIGPIRLLVTVKLDRRQKRPAPPGC